MNKRKNEIVCRIGAISLSLALAAGILLVADSDAAAKPKLAKTGISIEMKQTGKVSVKANGWTIKSVKISGKSEFFTAKANKKAITITGVEEGSGKIKVTIKAKKKKKKKTIKQTLSVKITGTKEGAAVLEKYTAPDKLNRLREDAIAPFSGTVKEEKVDSGTAGRVKKSSDQLSVKAYAIGDVHFYDLNLEDGKKKPLLIYLHAGASSRGEFFAEEFGSPSRAVNYALAGVRVVSIDAAGCGSTEIGPIDALACFAETVGYIDTLIEYYNTVADVDAEKFALQGMSMGGNISFAYVAHGKYRPTAILTEAGVPDYTELSDGPLYDCFSHGRGGIINVMSKKQIRTFAERYSPIHWPEKFKDVYVFTANYKDDAVETCNSCKLLGEELSKLGSTNYSINISDGDGHVPVPVVEEGMAAIREQLLS